MSATDFSQWAIPDLTLTLGGRAYPVRPPSVEDAKRILAAAAYAEVRLGLETGPLPEGVVAVLDAYGPGDYPALGPAHRALVQDGVDQETIDRMHYYAVFYWTRGKDYAHALAQLLWAPREDLAEGSGEQAPKAL